MLPEVTWEGIPPNSGLWIPGKGDRLVECTTEVKATFWVVAEEPSAAGGEWESQPEMPMGGSGVILEEAARKPCDGEGKGEEGLGPGGWRSPLGSGSHQPSQVRHVRGVTGEI